MKTLLPLLLAVVLAVGVTPAAAEGWPMAGANPERTSWVPEEVQGELRPAWYRPIEAYIPQAVQAVAARGKVYISSARGLYALKAADGELVWRFDTQLPLGNAPTIDGEVCYVGGMDRKLHALEADTGKRLWAFDGAGAGYRTNPLVAEGKVYLGNRDGYLYAVHAHGAPRQGALAWKFKTDGPVLFSAAYKEGVIYFASNDCHAYAVKAGDGELVWRSAKLLTHGFHSFWPVVYKDHVVCGGMPNYADGPLIVQNRAVLRLDQNDLFPAESDRGHDLGPRGQAPGGWAEGAATMDVSAVIEHYEQKPWRRSCFVLSRKDGGEYTIDPDGDGRPGYAPITLHWKHTHRHPPVVGPDGVLYQKMMVLGRADKPGAGLFMSRSLTTGWEINPQTHSRQVVLLGGSKAADEPVILSGGGNVLYEVLCCDREGEWYGLRGGPAQRGARGSRGQLWTYGNDLRRQFPGYDQMWFYFENRGMSGLWGFYGGPDGNYHNHGDQNPLIPYRGMLFTIKSNCVLAYGSSAGAVKKQPSIEAVAVKDAIALRSVDVLKQRLAAEIQKILDAGHLQPGYYAAGQFGSRYDHLAVYFQNPADTFYVLTKALPQLSASQQQALREYLRDEFKNHPPTKVAAYGWEGGAPRIWADYPPDVVAEKMKGRGDSALPGGGRWPWQYPPQTFYALWKYAEAGLGDAKGILDEVRNKLEVPGRITDEQFASNTWELNMCIAGCIGYLGLQKLAGEPPSPQVAAKRDRLLALWVEQVDLKNPWRRPDGKKDRDYHRQRISIARGFIWLVPELGDHLRQHALGNVRDGVALLDRMAPYWFNSAFEGTMGEGNLQHLYDGHALFQAKALILKEPREELDKYLDVPAFARGDLFYLLNLIETIEAGERNTLARRDYQERDTATAP